MSPFPLKTVTNSANTWLPAHVLNEDGLRLHFRVAEQLVRSWENEHTWRSGDILCFSASLPLAITASPATVRKAKLK